MPILPKGSFRAIRPVFLVDNLVMMFDQAAALGFALVFSCLPFLVFVATVAAYLTPIRVQAEQVWQRSVELLPSPARDVISHQAHALADGQSQLLGISLLLALFAASRAVHTTRRALNASYHLEETRPFWHCELLALAITFSTGSLFFMMVVLFALGGNIGTWLAAHDWMQAESVRLWSWARWPIGWLLAVIMASKTYQFLPNRKSRRALVTRGGSIAATLWLMATWGLSIYVDNATSIHWMYGSFGGVMILLLWLQLSAFSYLLGARIQAILESLR